MPQSLERSRCSPSRGGRRSRRSSRRRRELRSGAVVKGAAARRDRQLHRLPHRARAARTSPAAWPVPTPFGTIYSTNITPDAETGIGRWSEAAFRRAMREGVDREGTHLYPAFPYDHYTTCHRRGCRRALRVPDDARSRSRRQRRANELRFPFNMRLAAGRLEAAVPSTRAPVARPGQSAGMEPRRLSGRGPRPLRRLPHAAQRPGRGDGASAHSPAARPRAGPPTRINGHRPRRCPGTRDGLAFYLRHGWHAITACRAGPMAEVTGNLGAPSPEADVAAIATYVGRADGHADAGRANAARQTSAGARPHGRSAAVSRRIPASGDGRARRSTPAPARAATRAAGRCPIGGLDLSLSTASTPPTRRTSSTSCCSACRPPTASERRSCRASPACSTTSRSPPCSTYLRQRFSEPAGLDRRRRRSYAHARTKPRLCRNVAARRSIAPDRVNQREQAMMKLKVNGREQQRRRRPRHAAALRAARRLELNGAKSAAASASAAPAR